MMPDMSPDPGHRFVTLAAGPIQEETKRRLVVCS